MYPIIPCITKSNMVPSLSHYAYFFRLPNSTLDFPSSAHQTSIEIAIPKAPLCFRHALRTSFSILPMP